MGRDVMKGLGSTSSTGYNLTMLYPHSPFTTLQCSLKEVWYIVVESSGSPLLSPSDRVTTDVVSRSLGSYGREF